MQNTQNTKSVWKSIDDEFSYRIWLIEKEFGIGPILDDFPLMKIFHYTNSEHVSRYNKEMKKSSSSGTKTFAGGSV